MKKTLFMIVAMVAMLMMSSCSPLTFEQNAGYIDYSAFPGIFITESNSVSFEYQPIGSLYAEEISGQYQVVKKKVGNNEIYGDEYAVVEGKYRYADPQSALAYAVQKVKQMGGNGIINLKINSAKSEDKRRMYYVTGMVIKRN